MLPLLVFLLVLLLPSSQPLPAEGWETYAFNPRLLAKVFYYKKDESQNLETFAFSGSAKPAPAGRGEGNGVQADALHQGLLSWQLHLPLAHQQSKCQVFFCISTM